MGSGTESVQPRYHIQRVGDQYELRSVGRLRSWGVRLIRGEYTASEKSLGRLKLMAEKLSPEEPKEAERLRGLVRSLTGMFETCPPGQKEAVRQTLEAVKRCFPQKEGEAVSPADAIHPQTKEEKVAIAKSIIERARAGKKAAHWPRSFFEGEPSPLCSCFQEYLTQDLSVEELAQTLEAIFKNAGDSWDALISALKSKTKAADPLEPKTTIQKAAILFANRILPPCVKALEDPKARDFGGHVQTVRLITELIRAHARADEQCLQDAFSKMNAIFQNITTSAHEFSLVGSRLGPRFLGSASTEVEEIKPWAQKSPSATIMASYCRCPAIGVGGTKQVKGDEQEPLLLSAYRFNQKLMEYLKTQGVCDPQEVANQLMLCGVVESSFTAAFASIGMCLPQQWLFLEVQNLESHPVIRPDQASIRFSVKNGRCIIERDCLLNNQLGDWRTQYTWCVSRIEVDPNAIGDQWTETVTTKPYAEALADEVLRRVAERKMTQAEAIADITKDLKLQIPNGWERQLELMSESLKRRPQ